MSRNLQLCTLRKRFLALALILALSFAGHSFAHARIAKLFSSGYSDIPSFLKANTIENLEDYISWLQENISYASDATEDRWADPLDTLNFRSGDCEDIAFLNAEVLKSFGFEARVLAYGHDKEAHVICLFIKDGKYYIFDNTQFYRDITSPSLKEIFHFLASKHQARYLLELSLKDKNFKVLYSS
jgi:predicted transglutaminase-like cysteine proteinase